MPCKDANSMCSSGICQCNSGYRNIDSECREGNDFNEKICSDRSIHVLQPFKPTLCCSILTDQ